MRIGASYHCSIDSKVSDFSIHDITMLVVLCSQLKFNLLLQRFGIIHAPAGAAAVVFAMTPYSLEHNLIFLVGVLLSVVIAVAINNLSDRRQYPIYY